jgi:hypothetical protein
MVCQFLGALEQLGKANITFIMSVCQPVALNNLVPTGLIFIKTDIGLLLEKMSRKCKF